ncbi:hypothetical protein GOODEAATRI_008434 [Goodea atripinnis]|uniref:VWFD domain-containing protein n=1 Tax=Goodea atripinnis TaxID=208336 RepID=A0ABV0PCF8_9TELE
MYLIRSPAGLKVQWYHSTGMMVIDTDSSGIKLPTMGLCGFCDGDITNDLTLPNGTILGVSKDPTMFIDSWQVPNTTSYVSYSRRREHNCSTSDCSRCLAMLEDNAFTPSCTDSSGVPRAHGEVWKASKDGCCMYRCDNDTIVPVEYNCSSMPAPVCHRTGEMIISMSDDTSCCPHKVCGGPTELLV